jgi:hypothetical protein
MEQSRIWIEIAAHGVEALAVAMMVALILIGTMGWFLQTGKKIEGADERYRIVLGKHCWSVSNS